MNITETSRYISLILRHKPEVIGISLDEHAWANVDELIHGTGEKYVASLGWQGLIVGVLVAVIPQALTLWGAEGISCLKELLARI